VKPRDGDRFADLVRDARRINPGPARGARKEPPRPRAAPRADADATPGFRWPEPGNRHLAAAPGISDALLNRLGRGDSEPEEKIDLHGTRLAEAKRLLATRLESARARGVRCVLVVHGRGKNSASREAVLRDALPESLTRGRVGRDVLAFAPAPRRLGGEGATLVLLRKPD